MGLTLVARGEVGVDDWVAKAPDPAALDARTRAAARSGRLLGRRVLGLARALERRMQRRIGAIFNRADVLLVPTSARPPLPIGASDGLSTWATQQLIASACPFAWPWNVLGWPGVSVPAGLNRDGLPLGVQLLGPAGSEGLLLSLAAQLERVERWTERVAPFAVPAPALL
jgi:amidase